MSGHIDAKILSHVKDPSMTLMFNCSFHVLPEQHVIGCVLEIHHFQHCCEAFQWCDFGESYSDNCHLLVALEFFGSGKVSGQFDGLAEEAEFVGNAAADEHGIGHALVDEASQVNHLA